MKKLLMLCLCGIASLAMGADSVTVRTNGTVAWPTNFINANQIITSNNSLWLSTVSNAADAVNSNSALWLSTVSNSATASNSTSVTTNSIRVVTMELGDDFDLSTGTLSLHDYPSILTITNSGPYYMGQTATNPTVTWTVNKSMTTRTVEGEDLATLSAGGDGTYFDTGRNLTWQSPVLTYTLTVGDGVGYATGTTTFVFNEHLYVGGTTNTSTPSSSELQALTGTPTLTRGASGKIALTNQYLTIAYPEIYGYCQNFSLGGMTTSSNSWIVAGAIVTNVYGYSIQYLIYKSTNALTSGSMAYDID